jgi:hypothetical protein
MIPTLIEVAEGSAPEQREPAPALMLGAVVQHVAALAERLQVRGPVVGWVVIEMRAGQDHARRPDSPLPVVCLVRRATASCRDPTSAHRPSGRCYVREGTQIRRLMQTIMPLPPSAAERSSKCRTKSSAIISMRFSAPTRASTVAHLRFSRSCTSAASSSVSASIEDPHCLDSGLPREHQRFAPRQTGGSSSPSFGGGEPGLVHEVECGLR